MSQRSWRGSWFVGTPAPYLTRPAGGGEPGDRLGIRSSICCAIGSWGGRRLSLAFYVTGMGAARGATAAGAG